MAGPSSNPTGMSLPQELADYVIDQLVGDRAHLLACSEVARAWRPRALAHLFRSIWIIQLDGPHSHSDSAAAPKLCLRQFEQMRRSEPHLLLHLRSLALELAAGGPGAGELRAFARTLSLPDTVNVVTLRLIGKGKVDWTGVFNDFPSRFPALRRVELATEHLLTLDELSKAASMAREIGFLLSYPHSQATAVSIAEAAGTAPVVMPNLGSMEIVNTELGLVRPLFEYLATICANSPNLRRVVVRKITELTLQPFLTASISFRNRIQRLTLLTAHGCQICQEHLDAVLTHCPNLRELEIQVKNPRTRIPLPSSLARVEILRYIYYGVTDSNDAIVLSCDSRDLDELALSSVSLDLVSFSFFIAQESSHGWENRTAHLVRRLLPGLWAAGKLTWHVKHARASGQYCGWPGYMMDWGVSSFRD